MNLGWDINTDGKITYSMINYDDYVSFEIEAYKKMQVLKYMLDSGLIILHQYSINREAILKSI